MIFQDFIAQLDQLGFTDVLLPFVLIFTVIFAVLAKTKILGENKKQFNVMIALVMGLAVVIPHITGSWENFGFDPVLVINNALPQVSIIVVAIVMMLLIIGVFGNEMDFAGTSLSGWIVILAFIAVGLIFGTQVGWFYLPDWLYFLGDPQIQSLVVMILVFGIIIWFVTKDDKDEKKGGMGMWIQNNPGKVMIPKSKK